MCMMCNGSSFDDALGRVLHLVDDVGWALVPIDGGGGGGWVYTVGLASRGHPELVIAGVAVDAAAATLDGLASSVFDGASLDECASAAGVAASTVHRIERGDVNPTLEVLERIAAAAGMALRVDPVSTIGSAWSDWRCASVATFRPTPTTGPCPSAAPPNSSTTSNARVTTNALG